MRLREEISERFRASTRYRAQDSEQEEIKSNQENYTYVYRGSVYADSIIR